MSLLVEALLELYQFLYEKTRDRSRRSPKRGVLRLVALVLGLLVVAAGGLVAVLESPVAGAILALAGVALFLLAI